MAKSPVGGSRAYITGRIGSDVYSLGKDGKGKRQQVVRALAEEVANPRSQSQMVNRMIMSTVMQAVKAYSTIIDHSFDGVAAGQPSISEFIRRNYTMLKSLDKRYNAYQVKGVVDNPWIISVGKAVWPAGVTYGQNNNDNSAGYGQYGLMIPVTDANMTVNDLRVILQSGGIDDYVTVLDNENAGNSVWARFKVKSSLAGGVLLSEFEDPKEIFDIETNSYRTVVKFDTPSDNDPGCLFLACGDSAIKGKFGAILSTKVNGKWQHTSCTLDVPNDYATNFDTALATYPVGEEQFLNGGDI